MNKYDLYRNIPSNPPTDMLVEVLCSDYTGEAWMKAKRMDYRPGHKGNKKWRWVSLNEVPLSHKNTPECWRAIA